MKSFFVFFIIIVFSLNNCFAQTDKNIWSVGGNFFYNNQKLSLVDGNQIKIETVPEVGLFVDYNVLLGIRFPITSDVTKYTNGFSSPGSTDLIKKIGLTSTGVAPFVQFYFLSTRIKPFINLSIDYTLTKTKAEYASQTRSFQGKNLGGEIAVGGAYFINSFIAFEAKAGIRYGIEIGREDLKKSTKIQFGIRVLLPKK